MICEFWYFFCALRLKNNLQSMIEIKAKGPALLEGVFSHQQYEFSIDRKCIWLGRGEELIQKQQQSPPSYIINLAGLSQAVSRLHACLLISPAFFYTQYHLPTFITKIPQYRTLPNNLLALIWQFVQSPCKIILRDLHSKTGIFRKIQSCSITAGLQVVLGDSRPLIFQNHQIHDTSIGVSNRLKELTDQGYVMLNPGQGAFSFWLLSFKTCKMILLDLPGKLLIGRSSDCNLVIVEASISRKHAHLQYIGHEWRLGDGDGTVASSNGVWVKEKKIQMDYRKADGSFSGGEKVVKIADVLLSFNIKEQHSYLGIGEDSSINGSMDESFDQLLRKELLQKEQSQLIKPQSGNQTL